VVQSECGVRRPSIRCAVTSAPCKWPGSTGMEVCFCKRTQRWRPKGQDDRRFAWHQKKRIRVDKRSGMSVNHHPRVNEGGSDRRSDGFLVTFCPHKKSPQVRGRVAPGLKGRFARIPAHPAHRKQNQFYYTMKNSPTQLQKPTKKRPPICGNLQKRKISQNGPNITFTPGKICGILSDV